MKRWMLFVLIISLLLAAFAGLQSLGEPKPAEEFPTSYRYHNLVDADKRFEILSLLEKGGLSPANLAEFEREVLAYNESLGEEYLQADFTEASVLSSPYPEYSITEKLKEANPDYAGYNCRITSYLLAGDGFVLQKPKETEKIDDILLFDDIALKTDASALDFGRNREIFFNFYNPISTEPTQDIEKHVENVKKAFSERGVTFIDNDTMSLISVFMHDNLDGDKLFVGHTGVLLKAKENLYYFVEKLSFELPYQVVEFSSKQALNDYLMGMYDVAWNQDTAAAFILENDALLEGYRENPYKEKSMSQN